MKPLAALLILSAAAYSQVATGAYRLAGGGYQLTTSAGIDHPAGGVFASDPGTARDTDGNTFLVGRDSSGAVWIRRFLAASNTFETSWVPMAGTVVGRISTDVSISGTAFVAARDAYNAYWLNSYTGSVTGWIPLFGVLATDPAIAATDTEVYTVGLDQYGGAYSNRYQIATSQRDWHALGGVFIGTPSAAVGADGALYIAARDSSGGI